MKLFIHIGSGKTGSTTIQQFLNDNEAALARQKTRYLGLYFEKTRYGKEKSAGPAHRQFFRDLNSRDNAAATHVAEVMPRIIKEARKKGIEKLIWSNESLFRAHDKLGPVLADIAKQVDVVLIGYLRRQDKWLMSAYQQWGIKHKTNRGRVMDFDTWLENWKDECDYSGILSAWEDYVSQDNIRVGIVERVDDLVSDFARHCGLDLESIQANTAVKQANARLRSTQAALFKLHNDCFDTPCRATEMEGFLARTGLNRLEFEDANAQLSYPTAEALGALLEQFSVGNQSLGRYEMNGTDSSFPDTPVKVDRQSEVSTDALISALLMALVSCESRIHELESRLKR